MFVNADLEHGRHLDAEPYSLWHVHPVEIDSLTLQQDGRLNGAIRHLVLEEWHGADPAAIARAAAAMNRSLPLTIGIATTNPPVDLEPLLSATAWTLCGPHVDADAPQLVRVDDPWHTYGEIEDIAGRFPQTVVALGQLLRQTPMLDTLPGLAAEASTYSMLLGGKEFAAWSAARKPAQPVRPTQRPLVSAARHGGLLSVVLDDPRRRNPLSFRLRDELFDVLEVAALDETVEQVELTGSGPIFCSGGDLSEFGTATDLVAAYLVRLHRAPWRLIDRVRDKVTVHTHGAAIGAGIEMAAFAGRITATADTFFQLPEVTMGLVPGAGGTVGVTRRIGRWRAAWMMVSGRRIDSATAVHWGLVDELREA
ncbi:enoyl-CoA hydratase/isomerase family protein [Nocardia sp. BSTN01]|uniref:enoyl-CoA hydratase/isomerase family protein n=1 Tax=Nocardia sp. BSTN01 TaxID=2783665 RepID=UPI00188F8213|nr:enoyl-CoA hydratase/isomerase family protein [Nocardia sp. BSTN01]MBF4997266.1 enoyl-CoA hydratase/isomerase family protein [Nocardia sp. BSTN01]